MGGPLVFKCNYLVVIPEIQEVGNMLNAHKCLMDMCIWCALFRQNKQLIRAGASQIDAKCCLYKCIACWDLQPSSALVSDANGDFANSPASFLGSKVYSENESDLILCASITWNILLMCH